MCDDGFEGLHVVDREFAEHFAIDLNAFSGEAVDELVVFDAAFSACCRESYDPQSSEISLSCSSISEGVLPRFHPLLVGVFEDVLFAPPISGCPVGQLFVSFVAHQATLNSCHSSTSFVCFRTGSQSVSTVAVG